MKNIRSFHLKIFIFGGRIRNILEQACFRNGLFCHFLFLISPSSEPPERRWVVIIAFPGYLHLYCPNVKLAHGSIIHGLFIFLHVFAF